MYRPRVHSISQWWSICTIGDGCTSWSIHGIASYYCSQRDNFGISAVNNVPIKLVCITSPPENSRFLHSGHSKQFPITVKFSFWELSRTSGSRIGAKRSGVVSPHFPEGRAHNSDWSVNGFIMVVYEKNLVVLRIENSRTVRQPLIKDYLRTVGVTFSNLQWMNLKRMQ